MAVFVAHILGSQVCSELGSVFAPVATGLDEEDKTRLFVFDNFQRFRFLGIIFIVATPCASHQKSLWTRTCSEAHVMYISSLFNLLVHFLVNIICFSNTINAALDDFLHAGLCRTEHVDDSNSTDDQISFL